MDDPWDFDTDRVIQELCTDARSWKPPSTKQPNPRELRDKLIEAEMDGQCLLRYPELVSFKDLFKELGIRKLPHKLFISAAVKEFRRRSVKFQQHLQQSPAASPVTSPEGSPELSAEGSVKGEDGALKHSPSPSSNTAPQSTQSEDAARKSATARSPEAGRSEIVRSHPGVASESVASDEPPRKKRRMAPILLSADPVHEELPAVPNQAETTSFSRMSQAPPPAINTHSNPAHTLYFSLNAITPADFEPDPGADDYEPFSFVLPPGAFPPGARICRSLAMTRLLRKPTIAATVDGDAEILPVFGESDQEYDSDTWAEIEAEKAAAKKAKNPGYLSEQERAEHVAALVSQLEEDWRREKLPKCEAKAYRLWNAASRRARHRIVDIARARNTADDLAARLTKMCDSLRRDAQIRAADIKLVKQSFEHTVYDKMYQEWLVSMLSRPFAPNKVESSRPRPRQNPKSKVVAEEDGEADILTSDSEDDMANFIEDDSYKPLYSRRRKNPKSRKAGSRELLVVDLTHLPDTPHKKPGPMLSTSSNSEAPQSLSETGLESRPNQTEPPPLTDIARIVELGAEHWSKVGDAKRLVIATLFSCEHIIRSGIVRLVEELDPPQVFSANIGRAVQLKSKEKEAEPREFTSLSTIDRVSISLARLFEVWLFGKQLSVEIDRRLDPRSAREIRKSERHFADFCEFLLKLPDQIPESPTEKTEDAMVIDHEEMARLSLDPTPVVTPEPYHNGQHLELGDQEASSDEDPVKMSSKRRRRVKRDKEALDMRESDLRRIAQQEERRCALRKQLASSGAISGAKSRLIINESKEESQGLIYITNQIAEHIKNHQIQGVRFMWNQVTNGSNMAQGCLLAHTMGLGKTMQVICLLVAIAEASLSDDETVSSQIPKDLRESKTLVLCPAGLVNNWYDELLRWAPEGLLGEYYKIDAELSQHGRSKNVAFWARHGGILIIGYTMFSSITENEDLRDILRDAPNIVVGDEAHMMKNPRSKIAGITREFRTTTRIAMTGSPLANSVEDFYAMINWVAPNYLGPSHEFTSLYATPIKEGLYADSHPGDKRRALKLLKALKDTVAPKVHRMTTHALKDQLPPKQEFVLFLPIHPFQLVAYKQYMEYMRSPDAESQITTFLHLFSRTHTLRLLLNHPAIFLKNLMEIKSQFDSGQAKKAEIPVSREFLGELIRLVNVRNVADNELSAKIVVLLRILEEAKRAGDKVLVFSQSIETIDFIETILRDLRKPYSKLTGKTAIGCRQEMVSNFNSNDDEVYLISTAAGGLGLNIQGANRVVIMDFKFEPSKEQQAIGRAYRIGQTKPVFVYWLVVGGTFEQMLHEQGVFKNQLSSRVVDKKNPAAFASKYSKWTAPPVIIQHQDLGAVSGKDAVLDAILQSPVKERICKIIMGDSFEEEEPDQKLSPEELQEANALVARNQLRIRDPEAYMKAHGPGPIGYGPSPTVMTPTAQSGVGPASTAIPMPVRAITGPGQTNGATSTESLRDSEVTDQPGEVPPSRPCESGSPDKSAGKLMTGRPPASDTNGGGHGVQPLQQAQAPPPGPSTPLRSTTALARTPATTLGQAPVQATTTSAGTPQASQVPQVPQVPQTLQAPRTPQAPLLSQAPQTPQTPQPPQPPLDTTQTQVPNDPIRAAGTEFRKPGLPATGSPNALVPEQISSVAAVFMTRAGLYEAEFDAESGLARKTLIQLAQELNESLRHKGCRGLKARSMAERVVDLMGKNLSLRRAVFSGDLHVVSLATSDDQALSKLEPALSEGLEELRLPSSRSGSRDSSSISQAGNGLRPGPGSTGSPGSTGTAAVTSTLANNAPYIKTSSPHTPSRGGKDPDHLQDHIRRRQSIAAGVGIERAKSHNRDDMLALQEVMARRRRKKKKEKTKREIKERLPGWAQAAVANGSPSTPEARSGPGIGRAGDSPDTPLLLDDD